MSINEQFHKLMQELTDPDCLVRQHAAEALGEPGNPDAVPPLIAALEDECKDVRHSAADSLGQIKDPRAVEPLIQNIAVEEGYDTWHPVRALRRIGDRRAIPVLLDLLYNEDTDIRDAAIEALDMIKDPACFEPLMEMLRNGPKHTQSSAAAVLGSLGKEEAVDELRRAMDTEGMWTGYTICTSRTAGIALARIGGKKVIEALIDAMKNGPTNAKMSAAMGLKMLKTTEGVESLVAALEDPLARIREMAASALAAINDSHGNEALLRGLAKEDLPILAGGYLFFIKKGLPGSEPLLIQALNSSHDNWMAHCFIISGNPLLEEAGREQHKKHNIRGVRGDGETAIWGSSPSEICDTAQGKSY